MGHILVLAACTFAAVTASSIPDRPSTLPMTLPILERSEQPITCLNGIRRSTDASNGKRGIEANCGRNQRDVTRAFASCATKAQKGREAALKGGQLMKTLFKRDDEATRKRVADHFEKIASQCGAREKSGVSVNCGQCEQGIAGKAYKGSGPITLCSVALKDTQSTTECGGQDLDDVLLHEMSHVLGSTDDIGYGLEACKQLDAQRSLQNADSYTKFARAATLNCNVGSPGGPGSGGPGSGGPGGDGGDGDGGDGGDGSGPPSFPPGTGGPGKPGKPGKPGRPGRPGGPGGPGGPGSGGPGGPGGPGGDDGPSFPPGTGGPGKPGKPGRPGGPGGPGSGGPGIGPGIGGPGGDGGPAFPPFDDGNGIDGGDGGDGSNPFPFPPSTGGPGGPGSNFGPGSGQPPFPPFDGGNGLDGGDGGDGSFFPSSGNFPPQGFPPPGGLSPFNAPVAPQALPVQGFDHVESS